MLALILATALVARVGHAVVVTFQPSNTAACGGSMQALQLTSADVAGGLGAGCSHNTPGPLNPLFIFASSTGGWLPPASSCLHVAAARAIVSFLLVAAMVGRWCPCGARAQLGQ
jgi:hypothetical protein